MKSVKENKFYKIKSIKNQFKFTSIKIIGIAFIVTVINIIISETIGYEITFIIYSLALIIFILLKH